MTLPGFAQRDRTTALWAISAADLAANMLCFFVLQFAMSEIDIERFRAASEGIGRGLGIEMHARAQPQATLTLPTLNRRAGLSVDYLAALLAAETAPGHSLAGATIATSDDRLTLSLPGAALFEAGGDRLRTEAQESLFALAGLLSGVPNRVEVQVHVRPNAERLAGFPSSWELALMRAAGVAARLREAGYTRPLAISGQLAAVPVKAGADAAPPAAESVNFIIGDERAQ